MTKKLSERRLAENEATFRKLNERVNERFDATNTLAREDNQPEFLVPKEGYDAPLQFYCECADEDCVERIAMNVRTYAEIHKNRNHFIVVPGHQVPAVEKVVLEAPEYMIVEKFTTPPENPKALHITPVDNV